jgi:hypothetical protein
MKYQTSLWEKLLSVLSMWAGLLLLLLLDDIFEKRRESAEG